MTTAASIRRAAESDVPSLLALIRAKAIFDGCLDALRADEHSLREAFFSPQPKAKALVAEIDGKVVGVATYYDIYSSFLAQPGIWLDDLFVDDRHRSDGVGRALITQLCEIARNTGCARADWIVARDNEKGRAFYSALGAEIFEQVRHARLDEHAIAQVVAGATE